MTNWLHAGWKDFLSNRYLLYQICELCAGFPAAGTPTQAVGLTRYFSDWICFEIDIGLALWRKWYIARAEERTKVGKYSTKAKYDSMDDILGVTYAREMGWIPGEEGDAEVSEAYKQAALEAIRAGKSIPDIVQFVDEREWGDGEADNEDAEWY